MRNNDYKWEEDFEAVVKEIKVMRKRKIGNDNTINEKKDVCMRIIFFLY